MLNHRMCSRTACGLALVSILACQALSADACKKDCGVIVAGQPKLWSLSDALYFMGDARTTAESERDAAGRDRRAGGRRPERSSSASTQSALANAWNQRSI